MQAILLSAPQAMKLLNGEGPDAIFSGGKYSGKSLAKVAKFELGVWHRQSQRRVCISGEVGDGGEASLRQI